jgi:hypothetical protein
MATPDQISLLTEYELKKLIEHNFTLVIDEVHLMQQSLINRKRVYDFLQRVVPKFNKVKTVTATHIFHPSEFEKSQFQTEVDKYFVPSLRGFGIWIFKNNSQKNKDMYYTYERKTFFDELNSNENIIFFTNKKQEIIKQFESRCDRQNVGFACGDALRTKLIPHVGIDYLTEDYDCLLASSSSMEGINVIGMEGSKSFVHCVTNEYDVNNFTVLNIIQAEGRVRGTNKDPLLVYIAKPKSDSKEMSYTSQLKQAEEEKIDKEYATPVFELYKKSNAILNDPILLEKHLLHEGFNLKKFEKTVSQNETDELKDVNPDKKASNDKRIRNIRESFESIEKLEKTLWNKITPNLKYKINSISNGSFDLTDTMLYIMAIMIDKKYSFTEGGNLLDAFNLFYSSLYNKGLIPLNDAYKEKIKKNHKPVKIIESPHNYKLADYFRTLYEVNYSRPKIKEYWKSKIDKPVQGNKSDDEFKKDNEKYQKDVKTKTDTTFRQIKNLTALFYRSFDIKSVSYKVYREYSAFVQMSIEQIENFFPQSFLEIDIKHAFPTFIDILFSNELSDPTIHIADRIYNAVGEGMRNYNMEEYDKKYNKAELQHKNRLNHIKSELDKRRVKAEEFLNAEIYKIGNNETKKEALLKEFEAKKIEFEQIVESMQQEEVKRFKKAISEYDKKHKARSLKNDEIYKYGKEQYNIALNMTYDPKKDNANGVKWFKEKVFRLCKYQPSTIYHLMEISREKGKMYRTLVEIEKEVINDIQLKFFGVVDASNILYELRMGRRHDSLALFASNEFLKATKAEFDSRVYFYKGREIKFNTKLVLHNQVEIKQSEDFNMANLFAELLEKSA